MEGRRDHCGILVRAGAGYGVQRIEEGKGSWEGEWRDFLSTHPPATSRAHSVGSREVRERGQWLPSWLGWAGDTVTGTAEIRGSWALPVVSTVGRCGHQ